MMCHQPINQSDRHSALLISPINKTAKMLKDHWNNIIIWCNVFEKWQKSYRTKYIPLATKIKNKVIINCGFCFKNKLEAIFNTIYFNVFRCKRKWHWWFKWSLAAMNFRWSIRTLYRLNSKWKSTATTTKNEYKSEMTINEHSKC